ncbi:unnamed protein product [Camellia sinensis]
MSVEAAIDPNSTTDGKGAATLEQWWLQWCQGWRRRGRALATTAAEDKGIRYRGVRKRPWDRFAAEIRDPWKKARVCQRTQDTHQVLQLFLSFILGAVMGGPPGEPQVLGGGGHMV